MRSSIEATLRNLADPDLCITPDKPRRSKESGSRSNDNIHQVPLRFTSFIEDDSEDLGQPRSLKVRFDQNVNVKQLSPDTSRDRLSSETELKRPASFAMGPLPEENIATGGARLKISPKSKTKSKSLTKGSKEIKQYSYPISNFTADSLPLDMNIRSELTEPLPESSSQFLESEQKEEELASSGAFHVYREPELNIALGSMDHHVWANTGAEQDDVEVFVIPLFHLYRIF